MEGIRVDVTILHKSGSTTSLLKNVLLINKQQKSVTFVGTHNRERIYETSQFRDDELQATSNYYGHKQIGIHLRQEDERNQDEMHLKLVFKPPHDTMADFAATLISSLIHIGRISSNYKNIEDVIVDVTIIQKKEEPLILKNRQILIDTDQKCLQFMFPATKMIERKYFVKQMKGDKVRVQRIFANSNLVLAIELDENDRDNGRDVQLNLIFSPPNERTIEFVAALLNQMMVYARHPLIEEDVTTEVKPVELTSSEIGEEKGADIVMMPIDDNAIIADVSLIYNKGSTNTWKACRITFDDENSFIRFTTPQDGVEKFSIKQFLYRPIKTKHSASNRPIMFNLSFDKTHELNKSATGNPKEQIKIILAHPYDQYAEYVAQKINEMFESNKSEMKKLSSKKEQSNVSTPRTPKSQPRPDFRSRAEIDTANGGSEYALFNRRTIVKPISPSEVSLAETSSIPSSSSTSVTYLSPRHRQIPGVYVDLTIITTPFSVINFLHQRIYICRETHSIQFESPDGEMRTFDSRQLVNWNVKEPQRPNSNVPTTLSLDLFDSEKQNNGQTQLKIKFHVLDQKRVENIQVVLNHIIHLNRQAATTSSPSTSAALPVNRKRPSSQTVHEMHTIGSPEHQLNDNVGENL